MPCENCLKCGKETFHKAFELKKTGLKIFKYKCWESSQAECRGSQPLMKKEFIILDNASDSELRKPDYIKELCQYKTKCLCCSILIKRLLKLLDAIDDIKNREVIGICEHCKRRSKITCKKCEYLISKYVAERKALEGRDVFRQWLQELQNLLEPLPGDDDKCDHITGHSAATPPCRMRTRCLSGKDIPKEFRYPPTTREFFPDYGSPFVTQYPQPSDSLGDSFTRALGSPSARVDTREETKTKPTKKDLQEDPNLERQGTLIHNPLMRGPSEFPVIEFDKSKYDNRTGKLTTPDKNSANISDNLVDVYADSVKRRSVFQNKISDMLAKRKGRRIIPEEMIEGETLFKNNGPHLREKHMGRSPTLFDKTLIGQPTTQKRKTFQVKAQGQSPDDYTNAINQNRQKPLQKRSKPIKESQSMPGTNKKRQLPNKLPYTHPSTKKEGRYNRDSFKTVDMIRSEDISKKIKKNLFKTNLDNVDTRKKVYSGLIDLLRKRTSPTKSDKRENIDEKSRKSTDEVQVDRLDSINTNKDRETEGQPNVKKDLKSIIAKRRRELDDPVKNVALRVKQENRTKEPKNLHKLDVKLEKLIYNNFIKRMAMIKELKHNKNISDSDHEEEEEYFFSRLPVIPVIESDPNLAPVECPSKKKPNLKIVGDRIMKCKPKVSKVSILNGDYWLEAESNVNFNPPLYYWENTTPEYATPVVDARIVDYELSNPRWITNGWTVLPKQVKVREIPLYDMIPLENNWFSQHKNRELVYKTGERLAIVDEEGNGKVFYKNGKVAMVYTCDKDANPERLVVYSSGEGACKLAAIKPIRKLAVFDHLGSGVVYDAAGHTRLKYNQSEGQKFDNGGVRGVKRWKFHSLNKIVALKTKYEETIEKISADILQSGETKRQSVFSPPPKVDNEVMLAIERDNKLKALESKAYELLSCDLGPIRINKYFVLHIKNQRDIKLHFEEACGVVVNLGMRMMSNYLIGYLLCKETEVVTPLDNKIDVQYY